MFAGRLRYIRTRKDKTQKEMALELNLSDACYSNYENGKRVPDYDTLLKIAKTLNVSIDYLLGNEDYLNERPDLDANIMAIKEKRDNSFSFKKLLDNSINLNDSELELLNSITEYMNKRGN